MLQFFQQKPKHHGEEIDNLVGKARSSQRIKGQQEILKL